MGYCALVGVPKDLEKIEVMEGTYLDMVFMYEELHHQGNFHLNLDGIWEVIRVKMGLKTLFLSSPARFTMTTDGLTGHTP